MEQVVYGNYTKTNSKVLNDVSTKKAVDSIRKNIDTLWAEFDKSDNYVPPKRVRPTVKVK